MHEKALEPAPRGWIEKANDYLGLVLPFFVMSTALYPLHAAVGSWWLATIIIIVAGLALMVILDRLVVEPQREKRASLDAAQGIFECAHREKGSALKGRWARGYAKPEPGRLLFQTRTGVTGPLAGPLETYSEVRMISQPAKAPWSVFPRGKIITLSTDKGIVEIAAAPSGHELLEQFGITGSQSPK
jgi:hypothetical protein